MSDEAPSHSDMATITRNQHGELTSTAGLASFVGNMIYVAGLAPAAMSYQASGGGNFYDGVSYWTGSGADTVTIEATEPSLDATHRTTTEPNTGLGNNNLIA